jgi:hypothetical protein
MSAGSRTKRDIAYYKTEAVANTRTFYSGNISEAIEIDKDADICDSEDTYTLASSSSSHPCS